MISKNKFYKSQKKTVFQISTKMNPYTHTFALQTTREVREHLEVANTFPIHKRTDRIDYMSSVGIDYDQAVKYIDIVESLDRSFYKNDVCVSFWKRLQIFLYGFKFVFFFFKSAIK